MDRDRLTRIAKSLVEGTARAAFPAFGIDFSVIIRELKKAEDDLDKQVQDAFESLQRSTELTRSLQQSIKERAANLRSLQAEYQDLKHLSEITREQTESLRRALGTTIRQSRKWDVPTALGINLLSSGITFILGVFFAEDIKNLLTNIL